VDRILLVGLAGAIGSITRYLVVNWGIKLFGPSFPWGVLTVNIVGSFFIAFVSVLAITKAEITPTIRVALTAGFLGGLTTYSSFNQDTLAMLDKRLFLTAAVYVLVTLVVCMGAGFCGTYVARRL
jgi:CrcB protein